jgi:hypothetical protein
LYSQYLSKIFEMQFKDKALTFLIEKLLSAKFKAEISIQTPVPLSCLLKEIVSEPFQVAGVSISSLVMDGEVDFMVLLNANGNTECY